MSRNPEARTGLRDQLVDRYMIELDTDVGVFVVVWMETPNSTARRRRLWDSPAQARDELMPQAKDIMSSSEGLDIRTVVIDASLPTKPRTSKGRKRTAGKAASAPPKKAGIDSSGKKRKSAAAAEKSPKATGAKKKSAPKRTLKKVAADKKKAKSPAIKKKHR